MAAKGLDNLFQQEMTRKQFLMFGALAVGSVFGVVGIIKQLQSHAATATATLEPETGTKTSPAVTVTDTTASGSSAIKFVDDTPATTRVAYLYPFNRNSPWNTPIGSGAVFESSTAARTAKWLASPKNAAGDMAGHAVNYANWTNVVYQAKSTDPLIDVYKVTYGTISTNPVQPWLVTGRTTKYGPYRIPYSAVFATQTGSNTDRPIAVVQPDGYTMIELYKFGWYSHNESTTASSWKPLGDNSLWGTGPVATATNPWASTTYFNINDIRGHGLRYGSQASGTSHIAGLIRKHEVASGEINHALKVALTPAMYGMPQAGQGLISQNSSGAGIAVWPSRLSDTQSGGNIYLGTIPMGTLMAIPGTVDIAAIGASKGITANGMRVIRALQDYGAYPLLAAGTVALFAEFGSNQTIVSEIATAWDAIWPYMRVVTNNNPGSIDSDWRYALSNATVAGGGTRRRALLPPLAEGEINDG